MIQLQKYLDHHNFLGLENAITNTQNAYSIYFLLNHLWKISLLLQDLMQAALHNYK